jgi:dUTP pyrophosphatase
VTLSIPIRRLPHAADLPLPAYETPGAAGMDLRAAIPEETPVTLAPGARAMVPTGADDRGARGFEAQVRPRSGLAARHGIGGVNSPAPSTATTAARCTSS